MNVTINIIDKPQKNIEENIKVSSSKDVLNIKEVQAIRNAIREHLIFIGLDNRNNVRNVSILGIGTSSYINVDSKEIIRTALFSASDKVILVHNHPSNSINPSKDDIHMSTITDNMLDVFNIELVDHIIVTENDYLSMKSEKVFNNRKVDSPIRDMTKGLLYEENQRLKEQLKENNIEINKNEQEKSEYEM